MNEILSNPALLVLVVVVALMFAAAIVLRVREVKRNIEEAEREQGWSEQIADGRAKR